MRNLFLIPLIFGLGCAANHGPKLGSVFNPQTDLTTLSDEQLLEGYEVASTAVDSYEADLWKVEAGGPHLSSRMALGLMGKDLKTTLQSGLKEHKQVKERVYVEIQRRGLTPWEHKRANMESGCSFGLRWDTFKLHNRSRVATE